MFDNITVREAQIIGRLHLMEGLNMQDVHYLRGIKAGDRAAIYGIICDGCSHDANQKKVHSEVGARLGADFLDADIQRLFNSRIAIPKMPAILHNRLVSYLRSQVAMMPLKDRNSQIKFIVDKLMFTVIGFIYTETETLFFWEGDGVYIINDEITAIDQDDKPTYIGYHAIDRRWLPETVSTLPQSFETLTVPSEEIQKLAVASDGLSKEPDFYQELWGYKSPAGLQRKVNMWSLNDHKFLDDLSIITLEKT